MGAERESADMIAYVRGTLEYVEPEAGLVVLESGGVGTIFWCLARSFLCCQGGARR